MSTRANDANYAEGLRGVIGRYLLNEEVRVEVEVMERRGFVELTVEEKEKIVRVLRTQPGNEKAFEEFGV